MGCIRVINVDTKILGLIGYPLGHTLSPLLHNHTINEENMNYVYLSFPVEPDKFDDAVNGFKAINIRGFNVTIPYKEKIIPFLDNIDPLAKKTGAVNTVVNDKGFLRGFNTDVIGLSRMIKEDGNFDINGKTVMIVGAGGAARAAGISVLSEGANEIYLLNRTRSKAERLTQDWRKLYPGVHIEGGPLDPHFYETIIKDVDLLIDTTPIGMSPHVDAKPVIDSRYLHSNMLVIDLVYNPEETTLLKTAKESGIQTLNGMAMLLYQGIESFDLWTNHKIDIKSWKNIVEIK